MANLSTTAVARIAQAFGISQAEQAAAQEVVVAHNTAVKNTGMYTTTQPTPPTALTATGMGTTGTVTMHTSDVAGMMVLTPGGSGIAAGPLATATFATPLTSAPTVTMTPATAAAAALGHYVTATPTGFTVNATNAPTTGVDHTFHYQVIQPL